MVVEEGRWSWVVALACCTINCLLYGVARLSGLLLVATVDALHVSRAAAALPYSVSTSVRNLSGIFVGYLGQRFGIRPVVSAGCLLSALGAACCFFASDITWITVCWGGIFGMGCGLATCLLPLAINQHFGRHRGTASGISYSGSYIGSFAFPPLVVYLLEEYGLSGTFLVISATMLNGLAAAMLFRSPTKDAEPSTESSFFRKVFCRCSRSKTMTETSPPPSIYLIGFEKCENSVAKRSSEKVVRHDPTTNHMKFSCGMDKNSCLKISSQERSGEAGRSFYKPKIVKLWEVFLHHLFKKCYSVETVDSSTNNVKLISFHQNLESSASKSRGECTEPTRSHHQPNDVLCYYTNSTAAVKAVQESEASDSDPKCKVPSKNGFEQLDSNSNVPKHESFSEEHSTVPPSLSSSPERESSIYKDVCKCFFGWIRMLSDPMYVVITVTMSLHTFVVVCMVTIIEDFAKDIQVPCNRVHHVIMALSTADLVGALSLGTITDRGFISREVFMCGCLLGTGLTAVGISFSRGLPSLLALVSLYGLCETGVIITFPLLIAQFIREKKQPVALASSNVLSAPTVLCVPPLIGYFRDNIGCYSGVFYVLGLTSFVSSFIWLVAPFLVKKFKNKKQKFLDSC